MAIVNRLLGRTADEKYITANLRRLNTFDGIINNTPPTPTVDELEAKVQAGEQISLLDLAEAIKADTERGGGTPEKKPSIRAQLKADKERAAQRKTAAKAKSQDLERS